ncbi:MAG: hypothetical protein WCE75_00595 [Terracidiphilus sp.]
MTIGNRNPGMREGEELEPELAAALADFRRSLDAWSEAELSRPRMAAAPRRVWRLALGWALGCLLAAGGVSGGLYEHHRSVLAEQARIEQQRQLELERAAEQAREEEELMARVDSDVARQAPSALEPLAQLMAEDEAR